VTVGRIRDDELDRLGAFFSARIEEEEERLRRRAGHDEHELEHGDATSLKVEWERRAAEVRQRWEMRTRAALGYRGVVVAGRACSSRSCARGRCTFKLKTVVDVARGRPALPPARRAGAPPRCSCARRGTACCAECAPS